MDSKRAEKIMQRQHITIMFLKDELMSRDQDLKLIKKELSHYKRGADKIDLNQFEKELIR